MKRRLLALLAILVAGVVLSGCGSDDNGGTVSEGTPTTPAPGSGAPAKKVEVKAAGFAFDPTAIQLTAGEDVQFVITNGDGVEHNLTVDGLGVNQDVEAGKTEEADVTKAPKAGTYNYHCKYHPDRMTGTVTVT